jgi:hypothetical protein
MRSRESRLSCDVIVALLHFMGLNRQGAQRIVGELVARRGAKLLCQLRNSIVLPFECGVIYSALNSAPSDSPLA